MKIKTIYIDDVQGERNKYDRKFKESELSKDRFELITLDTPKTTENYAHIKKKSPDLILVDHDLSMPDNEGNVIGISGLTLITQLKQQYPYIPLVLFTKKSVFNRDNLSSFKSLLSVVDKVIYKSELFKSESTDLDELHDLAIGYQTLAKKENVDWPTILELLGAPEDDIEKIKQSAPPEMLKGRYPHSEIAKWIREILIQYPGILYDSLHAATFLGISEESFMTKSVQEYFKDGQYLGIFSKPKSYWWKSKLSYIAGAEMDDNESDLPIREGFPHSWQRIKDFELERPKCVYSEEYPAEWVCYILKKPMMIKYSLPYHPDSRPDVMDEARISFQAITTTNDVNPEMIDSIIQEKYNEIRRYRGKKGRAN